MPAPRTPLAAADIGHVADSFALANRDPRGTGRLFYDCLFRRDPSLRRLFRGDLDAQGVKLMDTLNVVVGALGHPDAVLPVARDLARRHVAYGVRAEHYATVGAALIDTLGRACGRGFDAAARGAWGRAYAMLTDAMIEAAYPEGGAADVPSRGGLAPPRVTH